MSELYSDFIPYLKTLEPDDWNKKVTDKWTVRDVVAHMLGWEKDDPQIIKSTWESKNPPWFMKTSDYDDFNQKSVELYQDYTPNQLLEEWEKWQKKVEEEVDRIGEDKLRAYPDLFGWLFDQGENSHYNEHYRQIKNILEKH